MSDDRLLQAARAVRENAHAPYSNFKVGAALRTVSGEIFTGCNVENVAYPEGTCAEAGAIAAMCAAGERQIAEVADLGADGVVIGAERGGAIDLEVLDQLLEQANRYRLRVTFHRAFDAVTRPESALGALRERGVRRVLTSGSALHQPNPALEQRLARLGAVVTAADGLEVVVCGGIGPDNARTVLNHLCPIADRSGAVLSIHAHSSLYQKDLVSLAATRQLREACLGRPAPNALIGVTASR